MGNDRLEVLRDVLRFAIIGADGAGHREGESDAFDGDDRSDLHELSPSEYRSLFLLQASHQKQSNNGYPDFRVEVSILWNGRPGGRLDAFAVAVVSFSSASGR
jgi:hypothetical protein